LRLSHSVVPAAMCYRITKQAATPFNTDHPRTKLAAMPFKHLFNTMHYTNNKSSRNDFFTNTDTTQF
jgi:hypothetical protein